MLIGFGICVLFALPALLRFRHVSPLLILRGSGDRRRRKRRFDRVVWLVYFADGGERDRVCDRADGDVAARLVFAGVLGLAVAIFAGDGETADRRSCGNFSRTTGASRCGKASRISTGRTTARCCSRFRSAWARSCSSISISRAKCCSRSSAPSAPASSRTFSSSTSSRISAWKSRNRPLVRPAGHPGGVDRHDAARRKSKAARRPIFLPIRDARFPSGSCSASIAARFASSCPRRKRSSRGNGSGASTTSRATSCRSRSTRRSRAISKRRSATSSSSMCRACRSAPRSRARATSIGSASRQTSSSSSRPACWRTRPASASSLAACRMRRRRRDCKAGSWRNFRTSPRSI